MTATISPSCIGQKITSRLQYESARIKTSTNTPSTKSLMEIVTYNDNLTDIQRAQRCRDVSPRMRRLVNKIVKKFKNGSTSMIIRIVGEICTGKTTVSNQLHALLMAHNVPCIQLQEVSSPHMFTIINKLEPTSLPKQVVIIDVGGAGRIPTSFTKAKEAAIAAATESAKASGATDDDAAKAGHKDGAAVVMFIRMRVAFPPGDDTHFRGYAAHVRVHSWSCKCTGRKRAYEWIDRNTGSGYLGSRQVICRVHMLCRQTAWCRILRTDHPRRFAILRTPMTMLPTTCGQSWQHCYTSG